MNGICHSSPPWYPTATGRLYWDVSCAS
jgi:hypothetical protein